MATNPNEAAFPQTSDNRGPDGMPRGLTKREYFAKAAMQGLLANTGELYVGCEDLAADALQYADALIKALNGGDEA